MRQRNGLAALVIALGLLASGAGTSAQDKPPAPRTLDLVTGVLLYCMPIAAEAWTKELCASIDKEAATLAKTANVRFVALKTTDNDATNKQKARDAGFDPTNALWLLIKVQRMGAGARPGWNISLQADANTLPHAVSKGQSQRLVYTQGATLDAGIGSREAAKGGKMLLDTFFETFSKPVKSAAQ